MHKTRLETVGISAAVVAAAAGVSQAWTAWQAYQLGQQNSPSSISISSPSPAPAATPNSPSGVSLASEVGANYTQLQNLLKAQKFKEADQETSNMMLFAARGKKEGILDSKDINNFPCQDLRTIDQLWMQNSNGHFGFSTQRQVYNQADQDFGKFASQVEWRVKKEGETYYEWKNDRKFEISAPVGHLPSLGISYTLQSVGASSVRGKGDMFSSVASRLAKCRI